MIYWPSFKKNATRAYLYCLVLGKVQHSLSVFLTDIFSQYTFIVGGRWHARAIALIQVRLQHSVSSGL